MRDFAINFKGSDNQLVGLCDLVDKSYLMCSATFSELETDIVTKVLGVPKKSWKQYSTAKEFLAGHSMPITFTSVVPKNESDFASQMHQCVSNAKDAPILVFLENYEGEERSKVRKVAEDLKLTFREMPDEETLTLAML